MITLLSNSNLCSRGCHHYLNPIVVRRGKGGADQGRCAGVNECSTNTERCWGGYTGGEDLSLRFLTFLPAFQLIFWGTSREDCKGAVTSRQWKQVARLQYHNGKGAGIAITLECQPDFEWLLNEWS